MSWLRILSLATTWIPAPQEPRRVQSFELSFGKVHVFTSILLLIGVPLLAA
jgi:hypothetical protein